MLRKSLAKLKQNKALELFAEGVGPIPVAERLGVNLATCRRWYGKWRKANGVKTSKGRPKKNGNDRD